MYLFLAKILTTYLLSCIIKIQNYFGGAFIMLAIIAILSDIPLYIQAIIEKIKEILGLSF